MIAVDVCRTPVPALPSYPPQHPLCQFRWVSTRLVYDGVRAQAQQQPLHMFTQQILRSSRRTACPVHSLRTPSGVLLGARSPWPALPLPVPSLTVVAAPAVASGLSHIVLCSTQHSLWVCSCAARRPTAWHVQKLRSSTSSHRPWSCGPLLQHPFLSPPPNPPSRTLSPPYRPCSGGVQLPGVNRHP